MSGMLERMRDGSIAIAALLVLALPPGAGAQEETTVVPTGVRYVATRAPRLAGRIGAAAVSSSVQNIRLLVVQPTFADVDLRPSVPSLQDSFFGARSDSVSSIFKEMSFGKLNITGDVWVADLSGMNFTDDLAAMTSYMQAHGIVEPSGYDMEVWAVGSLYETPPKVGDGGWLAVHEMGHMFGLVHACAWDCRSGFGGAPVTIAADSQCVTAEYRDVYDAMGHQAGHYNAYHKQMMGWLDPANVTEVTADGVYHLAPIELPSSGAQMLMIHPAGTPIVGTRTYYAELRIPTGWDSAVVQDPAVQLRLAGGPYHTYSGFGGCDTQLIQQQLTAGSIFNDDYENIHVSVDSIGSSGASVRVHFGGAVAPAPPPSGPPPVVTIYSPQPQAVVSKPIDVLVAAPTPAGLSKLELYDNGKLIATIPVP